MATRYVQLRDAIELLASPASVQVEWLDRLHSPLTNGKSAEAYGNDELAMEFADIAAARGHMLDFDELTTSEAELVAELDKLLYELGSTGDLDFWKRKALYDDPRWQRIRLFASSILAKLPNEQRESDWTRGLRG